MKKKKTKAASFSGHIFVYWEANFDFHRILKKFDKFIKKEYEKGLNAVNKNFNSFIIDNFIKMKYLHY